VIAVLEVALSAALYAAAFPTLGVRLAAWVALVPLLGAIRDASPRRAALLGALWAMCMAYGVGTWLPRAVSLYYDQPVWVGAAFFVGVAGVTAAPFLALFAAAYAWVRRRAAARWLPDALWTPSLWVACELARSRVGLAPNPWVLLGYSQVGIDRIAQVADLTGVYGVSFLVASVNGALAACAWPRRGGRRPRVELGVAALLVVLVLGYGEVRLGQDVVAGAPVRVALVQGNVDLGHQWREEFYGANLEVYLRLTREVLAQKPDLVVWPESAVSFFLAHEPVYQRAIGNALAGTELVLGGPHHDGAKVRPRFRNSGFVLGEGGEITDRYDKLALLPFAEYFPLRSIELLRRRFERVRVFTPGSGPRLLHTSRGRLGTLICFEAIYPEYVGALVRAGAAWLVNLSNEAWLGNTDFPLQYLNMASLRAIENRRYLIRSATSGVSAIIDPHGRVVTRGPLFEEAVLVGEVRPIEMLTVYARIGDVFAGLCTVAALAVLLAAWRRPDAGAT
jgi:apolipoprotein N-acyltransferase